MQQMNSMHSQYSTNTAATSSNVNDNFKVIIRLRPPLMREIAENCEFRSIVQVHPDNKSCSIMEYLGAEVNDADR